MGTIASLNPSIQLCCFPCGDTVPMHIGQRIKRLMQQKGVSTEAAAFHCGVTPGAVSNWFSSGSIARDNLVVMADLLGESLRYLITGDERDRPLGELEAEYARRDVGDGTRQALLTLIRACPLRPPPDPPAADADDADAQHFKRAIEPHHGPSSAAGKRPKRSS